MVERKTFSVALLGCFGIYFFFKLRFLSLLLLFLARCRPIDIGDGRSVSVHAASKKGYRGIVNDLIFVFSIVFAPPRATSRCPNTKFSSDYQLICISYGRCNSRNPPQAAFRACNLGPLSFDVQNSPCFENSEQRVTTLL